MSYDPTSIRVVTPPTGEPIAALDVWRHLRLDSSHDSPAPATVPEASMVAALLSAAREHAEAFTGLSLAPTVLEVAYSTFPTCTPWPLRSKYRYDRLDLPRGPVQSVTEVTYIDTSNAVQTLDPTVYQLQRDDPYAWLSLAWGKTWPGTLGVPGSVTVRYVAGFSLPGDSPQTYPFFPASIRAAMLLLIGNWFENREAVVIGQPPVELPLGVQSLLNPHRVRMGV
jgi:uncharacterized phiE125 gp8 family phage protein